MSKYSPMVQNSKGAKHVQWLRHSQPPSSLSRGSASCVAFPMYVCVQCVYSSPSFSYKLYFIKHSCKFVFMETSTTSFTF